MTYVETARKFRATGYLASIFITIFPIVDMSISAWPFRLGQPAWRYAFLTVYAATAITTLMALFIFLAISVTARDRIATLIGSSVCAVLAVVTLAFIVVHALDWIQLRPQVTPGKGTRFAAVAVWTMIRLLCLGISFTVASITAFRTTRRVAREDSAEASDRGSMLVGTPGAQKAGAALQQRARLVPSEGD